MNIKIHTNHAKDNASWKELDLTDKEREYIKCMNDYYKIKNNDKLVEMINSEDEVTKEMGFNMILNQFYEEHIKNDKVLTLGNPKYEMSLFGEVNSKEVALWLFIFSRDENDLME